ncbi:polyubiquitin-like [Dendrobium catenatum]|uniref:polyubiquitin-like n=1 Tax=Dendrobium catenatum TaxID=906689 RepID=UPI0010A012F8|nr:polyubiquitin-like [Dendrobium catenatum]
MCLFQEDAASSISKSNVEKMIFALQKAKRNNDAKPGDNRRAFEEEGIDLHKTSTASNFLLASSVSIKVSFKVIRSLTLDVLSSDTIGSIKDKIYRIEGTSVNQQELFFAGNHLEDTKALSNYVVSTDSDSTIDVWVEGRMPISIKIPSMEKTLPLNVKYVETVQKLKVMIQDEVGIPSDQQLLIFCGKTLKDDQLLIACGIIKDSTVYVMMNPLAELLLYVQMACDKTFSLEVKAGYTISDVKVIVESLRGISASQMKVFHNEVELQDSFTLSFYKIKHQSILHLQAQIQIFPKLLTGKIISITAEASDTIAIIISKIASMIDVKSNNLRLSYARQVLDDQNQKTLAFYGINGESTIIIRLRFP